MPDEPVSERELRRLATRRAKYGPDFESRNASRAGKASTTKFNSQTGREAALKRQRMIREAKLKKRDQGGTVL